MGRNGQPIDILTASGRKHLSKAEIQHRKESEIKFGKSNLDKLRPPEFVKNDPIAFKRWKDCLKEFKSAAAQGVDILTSSDVGLLSMYCKTFSEYQRLLSSYQRVDSIAADCEPLEDYLENSHEFNAAVKKQLSNLLSIDGLLRIETAINKKMDMLIKMEDRLFLNPLAKVKNVPKLKKDDKRPSKFGRFGAGRNE